MPGVHHKNGVWIVAGPQLRRQRLPVLTITQGGALVYALMGLPIPHQVPANPPIWLQSLLPFQKSDQDTEEKPQLQAVSNERTSVLDRLHAMGYLD